MDEREVIKIIQEHGESKFPMKCPCCGIVFNSLAEYIRNTIRVGDPISYDVEMEDWEPSQPLGTHFYANCNCNSTLSLSSKGMNRFLLWRLILWFRIESWKRGIDIGELLSDIRSKIRNKVLSESAEDQYRCA